MKTTTTWPIFPAVLVICFAGALAATAKSPESIKLGMKLFERDWTPSNPKLGSDGLGPLFNATSCATCHNQGGSGGGGESKFNATSIGIERMEITGGKVSNDVVARMLKSFHPGFIQPGGTMINTMPLVHHGGSPPLAKIRDAIRRQVPATFSEEGGPSDAIEVRHVTATPITFRHTDGNYKMSVRARLFQRNTTALFGSGLIDQVSDNEIRAQRQVQKRHPEISGRPSTLADGRIGKFGWRANIATLLDFNDQACANEVGLKTRRKPQPSDPTYPTYRNPNPDITDDQIRAINDFVEALPAPGRDIPKDTLTRLEAKRGEQRFASVGCAVCHVPNMGPAKGLYSDLLLHDMGYELLDLNHAEPYIRRVTAVTTVTSGATVRAEAERRAAQGYYGRSTRIGVTAVQTSKTITSIRHTPRGIEFNSPDGPLQTMRIVELPSTTVSMNPSLLSTTLPNAESGPKSNLVLNKHIRIDIEPTKFNQEWRTAPLWGLRDSAPYMHDGRAETVLEAISMHDGESAGTRDRFLKLSLEDRNAILAFLDTMVAPQGMESGSL